MPENAIAPTETMPRLQAAGFGEYARMQGLVGTQPEFSKVDAQYPILLGDVNDLS